MKKLLLTILIAFVPFTLLNAQTDTTKVDEESFDGFEEFESDDFEEFDLPFFQSYNTIEKNIPVIELQYGMGQVGYPSETYSGDFNPSGLFEAKIGLANVKKVEKSDLIIKYDLNYVFIENMSAEYGNSDINLNKLSLDAWRFGLGDKKGFGWKLGEFQSIVLYKSSAITWSKLDFEGTPIEAESDAINVFGDSFRFGTQFEAGVEARVFKNIGLNAGFERAQIFPRHMFWYWTGSEIIHGIGEGLIGIFTNYVEDSSPNLLPIVDFVLKNALSYGVYELRSEKMNWPFNTVAPLDIQRFKVGMSFYF